MGLGEVLELFNGTVNVKITDIYGDAIHDIVPLNQLLNEIKSFNSEKNIDSFMGCKVTKVIPREIKQFNFKYLEVSLNVVMGDERVVF